MRDKMTRRAPRVGAAALARQAGTCAAALAATIVVYASIATLIAPASAVAADKPGNVTRGKQLYMDTGCYQCHGTRGAGGGFSGPRLTPTPIPFEGFLLQLRHPRARMPIYTAVVMPDADVADIYAYLQSIPKGKSADQIPALKVRAQPTPGSPDRP